VITCECRSDCIHPLDISPEEWDTLRKRFGDPAHTFVLSPECEVDERDVVLEQTDKYVLVKGHIND
jgi:hypothetical protein